MIIATLAALQMFLFSSDDEWLGQPAQPQFVMGYHADNGGIDFTEQVPAGETVENWSRLITTMVQTDRYGNLPAPTEFAGTIVDRLSGNCPGAQTTPIEPRKIGDHQVLDVRADCPLNRQTGKPEVFLMRVIAGSRANYMVQIAFRHVPDEAEVKWARAHLDGLRICTAASKEPACAK